MSCCAAHWLCGPPWSYTPVSWYGFQHFPASSFTQTENDPSGLRGIPFAPGNVPKYESNDRFSWTTKTKWLMLSIPSLGSSGAASASETVITAALGAGDDAAVSLSGMTRIATTPITTRANRARLVRWGIGTAPDGSSRTWATRERATVTMGPVAITIEPRHARER